MHENDRRHCDRKVSNETINESSLKIISFRLFHDFPSFVFLALKRNKFTGKLSRKEEKKFNPISSNFPDIPNRIYPLRLISTRPENATSHQEGNLARVRAANFSEKIGKQVERREADFSGKQRGGRELAGKLGRRGRSAGTA